MRNRAWILMGIIPLLGMLAGCSGMSRVEMDYGNSIQTAKMNQILNPQAGKNLEPVTGLDGKAAKATVEKYQKSFEAAPTPSSLPSIITLGTSGGGEGGK